MLAAWAVGINGLCMNDNVGIRVGKYGAKVASLRVSVSVYDAEYCLSKFSLD